MARQNHLFSLNVCSSVSLVLIRHLYLVGHMAAWIQGIFPGSLEIRCGIARGGFLPRHDEDLREPLVRRQGSQEKL